MNIVLEESLVIKNSDEKEGDDYDQEEDAVVSPELEDSEEDLEKEENTDEF